MRAANGHPKPFPLKYVEIGNEQHGPKYASRYNTFYKAIKEKYPKIRLMASMGIGDVNQRTLKDMKEVDIVDEHAYKDALWSRRNTDHFDKYKRGDWDMYVGEYATNAGVGAGNMQAALSDAVYILGMERNADLVKWSSYAPLLVNVNDIDWPVNLINFDAAKSFGRISYYAIKLLGDNRADVNLTTYLEISKPKTGKPLFAGGIGLGTWDTQAEFKDVEIIQNGSTVYKSDFIKDENEWNKIRGSWMLSNDALAQTAEGPQLFATLSDKSFDTYTLKLTAKKTGGLNAFMIPFAVKDSNTYMRAHIGSWWNSHCLFEGVENGYDVAGLTDQKRLPVPIETGKWYDVRLEIGMDKVDCYLNDTLLMSYQPPPTVFALAGRDEASGDLVIKLVNASGKAVKSSLNVKGEVKLSPHAELTVLSAEDLKTENSFSFPEKYIPRKQKVAITGNFFEMNWQPYSINVLRIKDENWKK